MTDSSSNHKTDRLSESNVAFFGKITASVTHELNNVISIVDQNAGLLDDLIAGEQRGVPLSLDRLESISRAVQKQTQRGLKIIERLNAFAHSTDFDQTECDVGETIGNLVELTQRLASLKRMQLQYRPASPPVTMTGSPLVLQRVVFSAIGLAIEAGATESTIEIGCGAEAEYATVTVVFDGEGVLDEEQIDTSRRVVEEIGGRLSVEGDAGKVRLVVWLPLQLQG